MKPYILQAKEKNICHPEDAEALEVLEGWVEDATLSGVEVWDSLPDCVKQAGNPIILSCSTKKQKSPATARPIVM